MKSLPVALWVGLLSLSCPGLAQDAPASQEATRAKPDAAFSFEALKSLAGSWAGRVTTDPANSGLDGSIEVTMRVASRGNVLEHEIAPGGVPEPTLIYLENGRLTLVHYCEAGNRPRMVARAPPAQNVVEFDFVDMSGSPTPAYLHHFVFTIVDAE